jgi:hypothetical protein
MAVSGRLLLRVSHIGFGEGRVRGSFTITTLFVICQPITLARSPALTMYLRMTKGYYPRQSPGCSTELCVST